MTTFTLTDTVGDIVARNPAVARIFEQAGIDYCCGGKRTVATACREQGVDPLGLLDGLEIAAQDHQESHPRAATMSLAELTDHIERTHHRFLRAELPRLRTLAEKVALAHGTRDARLGSIPPTLDLLETDLLSHMMKEEEILFPLMRRLETNATAPTWSLPVDRPIRQMEREHEQAARALDRLRELTDGYTAPPWACNTYRALVIALAALERDMHEHVHEENNVLFPRAVELERRR